MENRIDKTWIIGLANDLGKMKEFRDNLADENNDKDNISRGKDKRGKDKHNNKFNKNDKYVNTKRVGTSQLRTLASECKAAQCCDEIDLLIKYKAAKSAEWRELINNKPFYEHILDQCDKIRRKVGSDNEAEALYMMSLFFGYLYQFARVWRVESAADKQA